MLDEYLFGRADRLSPERPVPVVNFERRSVFPGGAGNVVRNLRALGCEAVLVARVGDDETGRVCRSELERAGLAGPGLVEAPGWMTPRKLRVHAGQHALARIDFESAAEDPGPGRAEMLDRLRVLAPGTAAGLVSDYRKGGVDGTGVGVLAAALAGKPVVVDPKGGDPERYRGATVLVPNERELIDLAGAEDDAAAESLRGSLGLEALVLTRSERGVRLYDGGAPRDFAARARQVFDVTGAGDTFAAALTAFLASGEDLSTAAQLANLAAGIKVRKIGTATVTRDEIEAEIVRDLHAPDKRVDRSTLVAAAESRRERGEAIVFTNGCFDLLHAGHIQYLQASRALGECLVVGLNSDASVRRLKGDGRPILGEEERAEILSALSCVDYVVVFDEDTPKELIAAVRPDVLTKGADYERADIVGAELVASWGGRVERIPLVEGRSTSDIVRRIQERER